MMILSQDKKTIINMDQISGIAVEDLYMKAFTGGSEIPFILGKYETEDRVKEIIRDIYEKYLEHFEQVRPDGIINLAVLPKVFEMPEE